MASINQHRGLTVVEVMVSSLLVGLILVASLNTLGSVSLTRRHAVSSQIGPCLAADLMSEIMSQAYADPDTPNATLGLDSGELNNRRDSFDDVDDYDGWNVTGPVARDGTSLDYQSGWTREVAVSYVEVDTLSVSSSSTGLKRITVTVTSPEGVEQTFEALRSPWGMTERQPSKDQSYVSSAKLRLQTSELGTDVILGTTIRNHGVEQ